MSPRVDEGWHSPHNPWLTAVVATLAPFMEVLDTSIANVSLPHIAGSLGAGVEDSTWILTSYLVTNAIILPISAWLSALLGRRNFYMTCVALFTVSSLCCGLAPSLGVLVLFRLLQGLGGGGLQPSTQAILVDTFPPARRGMGMAVYGMTVVVAPIIGPTLGGWITDNFSWRWIFFINIPVGLLSLLVTPKLIVDPPYLPRRRGPDRFRVDWTGLGLLALGLGALQMVLDLGERRDWFDSPFIVTGAAVSAAALLLAALWELRHPDPIVNLRLLGERNLAAASLVMLVFGWVLYGSTVLLPLFMQTLLGYTAQQSGMAISPGGIGVLVLMPIVGWMVSRIDTRWMILFGTFVVAGSLFLMGEFSMAIDFRSIVLARLVQGLGLAFMFVPINTAAYGFVPKEQRNAASSLINLGRNMGGSIGIACVTSMLARHVQEGQSLLVSHMTPYDAPFRAAVSRVAHAMGTRTADPVAAGLRARALLAHATSSQAQALAYVTEFRLLAAAFLILVPFILLMRRARQIIEEPQARPPAESIHVALQAGRR